MNWEKITIHILPKITRSNGNQTSTFGQLIKDKVRIFFLEKSYTKYDGETIPRPFSQKSKFNIRLDQQSEILYNLFLEYVQVEDYQNILKLRC